MRVIELLKKSKFKYKTTGYKPVFEALGKDDNILFQAGRFIISYVRDNIELNNYKRITIDYPDIAWSNRPKPLLHYFPTSVIHTEYKKVTLLRRTK